MKASRGRRLAGAWFLVALGLGGSPHVAGAATLDVTTTTDQLNAGNDGACSLREAISSVNTGANFNANCTAVVSPNPYGTSDRINLPAGTYTLTISGAGEDNNATGDLDVRENLAIIGDGDPTITQTFAANDRILHAPLPTKSLTIDSVIVTGGEATSAGFSQGGNILFSGGTGTAIALNNTDVTNGLADSSGGQGGGIAAPFGANVTVQAGSLIQDNVAGGSGLGQGGGIHMAGASGSLTVDNSSITSNDANFNGPGITAGRGGGVSFVSDGPASIDLDNAAVDLNRAAGGTGRGTGTGGGIYVQTGGPVTLTADGGSISGNESGGGTGWTMANESAGFGGGLSFLANGATSSATLTGVDVIGNKAGGNGGRGNGTGGGIHTDSDLTLLASTVEDNLAGTDPVLSGAPDLTGSGGGIHAGFSADADLTITGSSVSDNTAGDNLSSGGGISTLAEGDLVVTDSTVSGNTVGQAGAGGQSTGGGIYRLSSTAVTVDAITRSTISGNVTRGAGTSVAQGAGLHSASAGTMSIDSSTISGNNAVGDNGDARGGGVVLDSYFTGPGGTYLMNNSTISGNSVTSANGSGGNGGGLAVGTQVVANPPDATVRHSTIADNSVSADTQGPVEEGRGGNLYVGTMADKVHLRASILTGGVSGTPGAENCALATPGGIDSLGENIESTTPTQCELDGAGDQTGVNPLIGPLALNAPGTTQTRALLAGSPAIDSVPAAGCPSLDQRGATRPSPAGGSCDAGAFELFQTPPVVVPPIDPPPIEDPPKAKCPKGKKLKKVKGKKKCVKKKRKKQK